MVVALCLRVDLKIWRFEEALHVRCRRDCDNELERWGQAADIEHVGFAQAVLSPLPENGALLVADDYSNLETRQQQVK